jgi:hypothetical protein
MTLQLLPSEFLIYEENFLFFFISEPLGLDLIHKLDLIHVIVNWILFNWMQKYRILGQCIFFSLDLVIFSPWVIVASFSEEIL